MPQQLSPAADLERGESMGSKVGGTVHPWYRGNHKWQVQAIAKLSKPITYVDPAQGNVNYDPRILWLKCPEQAKVLWFAYWISTNRTQGRMRWGQGPPVIEENVLLSLLREAIRQDFFTKGFLKELARELNKALSK